jgi:hypothetical protein
VLGIAAALAAILDRFTKKHKLQVTRARRYRAQEVAGSSPASSIAYLVVWPAFRRDVKERHSLATHSSRRGDGV